MNVTLVNNLLDEVRACNKRRAPTLYDFCLGLGNQLTSPDLVLILGLISQFRKLYLSREPERQSYKFMNTTIILSFRRPGF